MPVADWSSTAALNISVNGISIAEGCPPANLNNAVRAMMADVKVFYGTTLRVDDNVFIIADGDPDPSGMVEGDLVFRYTP